MCTAAGWRLKVVVTVNFVTIACAIASASNVAMAYLVPVRLPLAHASIPNMAKGVPISVSPHLEVLALPVAQTMAVCALAACVVILPLYHLALSLLVLLPTLAGLAMLTILLKNSLSRI